MATQPELLEYRNGRSFAKQCRTPSCRTSTCLCSPITKVADLLGPMLPTKANQLAFGTRRSHSTRRKAMLGLAYPFGPLAMPASYHRPDASNRYRSEEHTSELRSPCNVFRRLVVEKHH